MCAAVEGALNGRGGTLGVLYMQIVHSSPFCLSPSLCLINNNYYIRIPFITRFQTHPQPKLNSNYDDLTPKPFLRFFLIFVDVFLMGRDVSMGICINCLKKLVLVFSR